MGGWSEDLPPFFLPNMLLAPILRKSTPRVEAVGRNEHYLYTHAALAYVVVGSHLLGMVIRAACKPTSETRWAFLLSFQSLFL